MVVSTALWRHGICGFCQTTSAAVLPAGGVVILAEEFCHEIYRKSLARLFEVDENGHLQMYFNATLDVVASKVARISITDAYCNSIKDNSHE